MTHTVFVYGTLRSGERNNRLLQSGILVGRAVVYGKLYSLGGFPGLRLDAPECWVHGEVWTVDEATLANLDRLEGVAHGFYRRVRVPVDLLLGPAVDAWVYEISEGHIVGREVVESGDWVRYVNAGKGVAGAR